MILLRVKAIKCPLWITIDTYDQHIMKIEQCVICCYILFDDFIQLVVELIYNLKTYLFYGFWNIII